MKCLILFLLLFWNQVQAAELERLGRFEINEFALSPRLRLAEPGQGGFELSQSWIGFQWSRDESIRGVLRLGSSDLSEPVLWYSPKTRPQFGVSEAWLEGKTEYFNLRAGFLSIPQGFEGVTPEWSSVFPETRARHNKWMIKRDFGLQVRWQAKPWETSLTVHNGESDTNLDGQYWATGHWQYKNAEGTGVLLTASTGRTKPIATSTSEAGLAKNGFVFDPNSESKIRQGSLAFFLEDRRNLFLVEAGRGEILQNESKNSFFWGHFDLVYNSGGDLSLLLRYDHTQPNQKDSETTVRSLGTGFSISSRDNLQSLTFFAQKNEERPQIFNDELWLIFRLHSFSKSL